jgi:DNA-binding NarL/FixJ family response regulator
MVASNHTISRPPHAAACAWPAVGGRRAGPVDGTPFVPLTQAERRVLFLLQQGLSNKEISHVLGRAEPTIKNQVASCLRKYQVPSRTRLLAVLR